MIAAQATASCSFLYVAGSVTTENKFFFFNNIFNVKLF